jgi:hypothetical protein
MVENVIYLLIYIAVLVGLVYLIAWVLEQLGVAIPGQVMKVIWVILVLIVLLLAWRAFSPLIGNGRLFPR